MAYDLGGLIWWIRACLITAAFFTTAFPLLYALFPWQSTLLGRVLMLQAVAFALAIDATLVAQFWAPKNVFVIFWLNACIFTLISGATCALTVVLCRTNHIQRKFSNLVSIFRKKVTNVQ